MKSAAEMPSMCRLFVAVIFVIGAHAESFPSATPLVSPNGRWQIVASEITSGSEFIAHVLVLEDRSASARRVILRFPRHADAIWSPDSRHIAVTDHAGSDYSRALLFDVGKVDKPLDLGDLLRARYSELRTLMKNHHS